MAELTDIGVVKALCAKYNFTLSKGFGQNFIVNPTVCPGIADAAGLDDTCGVLEIGPGFGVLTRQLSARAAKVVCIEADTRLQPVLAETLADCPNVHIIFEDVLKVDLAAVIRQHFEGLKVMVCANLPYYITSPILMDILVKRLPLQNITVMVQKEAAQRITAAPGTRDAGAISYAVSYYAVPHMQFEVKPGSFFPPPKVTSEVIRLDIRPQPAIDTEDETGYFKIVRAAFGQRRKTAANAISNGLGLPKAGVIAAMQAAGLSPTARPEQLTLQDFAALQQAMNTQI